MSHVIKTVGIVFCCFGIIFLLRPDLLKHIIEYLKQGKRLYWVALIRLFLGTVFLLGAHKCDIPWIILVFGILIILKGLVALAMSPKRLRPKIERFEKLSHLAIRMLSLFAMLLGGLIVYSA